MQTATDFIKEELNKLGLLDKGQVMTNIFEKAKKIEHNQRGYTKEDVLKAGEIGEINHHDYKHIVKLLDEAREINETYGSKGSDDVEKSEKPINLTSSQTAVEWLYDKWSNCKEWKWEEIEQWFEQAKEMERSQMIEFAERLPLKSGLLQEGGTYCERGNVEEYYNKVYGIGAVSEGSNGTSSQKEISDEEVEAYLSSMYYVLSDNEDEREWVENHKTLIRMGINWYREQLKKKQNG